MELGGSRAATGRAWGAVCGVWGRKRGAATGHPACLLREGVQAAGRSPRHAAEGKSRAEHTGRFQASPAWWLKEVPGPSLPSGDRKRTPRAGTSPQETESVGGGGRQPGAYKGKALLSDL